MTATAKKPATIWPDGGLGHPCGHESSFDDGCISRDVFKCPTCGLRWRMLQDPPTTWWDGSPKPGERRMVIDEQMDLPTPPDLIRQNESKALATIHALIESFPPRKK